MYFACFVTFSLLVASVKNVLALSSIDSRTRRFTFSDNPTGPNPQTPAPAPSAATGLTRQLITGIVTPNIVTQSYCLCVPPGSCTSTIPTIPSLPSDGSGQLDIRIVNNGFPPISSTTSPTTCQYGLVGCCFAGAYQCGRRWPPPPGSPPAGLGQASFGEYPWQAAILSMSDVYIGSGALITAQHVLTVAHKVFNLTVTSFKVRVGEWNAASTTEPIPAQDVLVALVYIHPSFNPANLQNDVALIRLATPVSLTTKSTVATVCLPNTVFVNQRCWVSGWGKNDFGPTGSYQALAREVDVPLVPNANCQLQLQATRLGPTFQLNNNSFICAGGEAGKDACTGDGGSPLVCQSNGLWYVVGLVAWGIGCAQGGVPGVYVNVISYLPWIQTVLASS